MIGWNRGIVVAAVVATAWGIAGIAVAREGGSIPIAGYAQFWERDCEDDGACGLPRAISEKLPIRGVINEPATSHQLGMWSGVFEGGGASVKVDIYWRSSDEATVGYFAQQARVMWGGASVAECVSYADIPTAPFIAVGACAGFVEQARRQIGVSFSKF